MEVVVLIFLYTAMFAVLIYVVLRILLRKIVKVENKYSNIAVVFLSLFISLQQFPSVRKYTDKLFTYQATELKITFPEAISSQARIINIKKINAQFEKYQRKYRPVISRQKYYDKKVTLDNEQYMPHFWRWEDNSLYIYLSSRIDDKHRKKIQSTFNTRFFNRFDFPTQLEVISSDYSNSYYLKLLFSIVNFTYDKKIAVDSSFINLELLPLGRDEIGERRAVCGVTLKTQGDYWQPFYSTLSNTKLPLNRLLAAKSTMSKQDVKRKLYTQLSGVRLKVKLNNKNYNAITYTDKDNTYLVLVLETYKEDIFSDGNTSKTWIKTSPSLFGDRYAEVKRDCLNHQLDRYPFLNKVMLQNNFLNGFIGQPSEISVKSKRFSPFYTDVEIASGSLNVISR